MNRAPASIGVSAAMSCACTASSRLVTKLACPSFSRTRTSPAFSMRMPAARAASHTPNSSLSIRLNLRSRALRPFEPILSTAPDAVNRFFIRRSIVYFRFLL